MQEGAERRYPRSKYAETQDSPMLSGGMEHKSVTYMSGNSCPAAASRKP